MNVVPHPMEKRRFEMNACYCDLDFNCGNHDEQREWSKVLGIRPPAIDAYDAYEGGYKGRYFEGWDAA